MRVLELIPTMSIGGAESMAAALAFEMRARGHSVHIICLRDVGEMSISAHSFGDAGIPLIEFKKDDGFSLGCLRTIAEYCRRHRIDVIHGHTHQVNHYAVAAARMSGARVVVNTVHGIDALRMQWWARHLFRATCRVSSKLVAVSNAVADATKRQIGIASRQVTVIPNGITADGYLQIRERAADGRFVFGTVGRLVPVKDQATMIRAFAAVYKEHPQAELHVVGFGELQEQLEALTSALGVTRAVHFHGMRTDIAAFLSQLDCFVLSSKTEGLPMTLLEAMAAALPVVCTAVGGIPEVVDSSGCGWLAPAHDPQALAASMKDALLAGNRRQRGERGRSAVLERYSAAAMATAYLNLFSELSR